MTEQIDGLMYVLTPRPGSGQVLHVGELHGVSSLRLACGPIKLRRGLRVAADRPDPLPLGTTVCAKCEASHD